MTTIRALANELGCTVQNIYQHINANKEELKGHITKRGKKSFLDQYAVDLITNLVTPREKIVIQDQHLFNELNRARASLAKMVQEKEEMINMIKDLNERMNEKDKQLQLLEDKSSNAETELEKAKEELESFQPWWFGLYKKKK